MANPRLGHKKSRNGCAQCKRRRVKCDEQVPCSNCNRHNVECSLTTCGPGQQSNQNRSRRQATLLPSTSQSPRLATDRNNMDEYSNSSESSVSGSSQGQSLCNSPAQQDLAPLSNFTNPFIDFNFEFTDQPTCWIRDLELLHHYTTCTSLSIVKYRSGVQVFQESYPKLAFTHEFLMHGILALSALDLAFKNHEIRQNYMMMSAYHQQIAVSEFHTGLASMNSENCNALAALGSLLAIISFATAASPPDSPDLPSIDLNDVVNSFNLVQGITYILASPASATILQGPLAPLLAQRPPKISLSPLTGPFITSLAQLEQLNASTPFPYPSTFANLNSHNIGSSSSGGSGGGDAATAHLAITLAIASLRKAYASICCPTEARKEIAIWLWPTQVPSEFIALVQRRHGLALLVLANFAALVEAVGEETWFLRGWGRGVLAAVAEALGPGARGWLAEPMRWVREGVRIV